MLKLKKPISVRWFGNELLVSTGGLIENCGLACTNVDEDWPSRAQMISNPNSNKLGSWSCTQYLRYFPVNCNYEGLIAHLQQYLPGYKPIQNTHSKSDNFTIKKQMFGQQFLLLTFILYKLMHLISLLGFKIWVDGEIREYEPGKMSLS